MVSIMRPEQTLRLIQLYHAHYPEIARNNQDADGRNQKLQISFRWAKITDELNSQFFTLFTVEQYKKKVQNVQCTSRQKLFSGKRNLGEAEVEYLRLFEADKINEETLFQRAKSRVGSTSANNSVKCFSLPPGDFEPNQTPLSRQHSEENEFNINSDIVDELKNRLNESKKLLQLQGWNDETTDEQQQHEILVREDIKNDAENSLINNNNLKTTNNQQIDSAQQLLFALLNTTFDNIGNNNNSNGSINSDDSSIVVENLKKKRKLNSTNNINNNLNSKGSNISPNKRSRKLDRPIRAIEGGNNSIEETRTLLEEGIKNNQLEILNNNNNSFNSSNQTTQLIEPTSPINNNNYLNNNLIEQLCGKIDKTNYLLSKIIELINERLPSKNTCEAK